jgi:hypothetical protein
MPEYSPSLDNADLLSWDEAQASLGDPRILLVGNGASRALWEGFDYRSLYHRASAAVDHPLDEDDVALFHELGGRNFELVLSSLLNARRVCEVLGLEILHLRDRYRSIQRALREALVSAHIGWQQIPHQTLTALRTHYRSYKAIYTTNYDLVLYWAVMSAPARPEEFVDFFWGAEVTFDPLDTEVRFETATSVFYLHGALHLRRQSSGVTRKETAHDQDLLNALSVPFSANETPLIVTEGSSREKERAIRSSDYLAFTLDKLGSEDLPMVIFGQGLGSQDEHIARAIRGTGDRRIAVGIHASPNTADRKRRYASSLGNASLLFFDASQHPLGLSALKIEAA